MRFEIHAHVCRLVHFLVLLSRSTVRVHVWSDPSVISPCSPERVAWQYVQLMKRHLELHRSVENKAT
jgi:hypothetical protein